MFNPYPLNNQQDKYYTFVSDYGVEYIITFDISSHLTVASYQSTVYEFSFYALSNGVQKLPVDSRVSDTIVSILRTLFDDPFAILLYVCESIDGKQLARKRTFDKWYIQCTDGQQEKYDFNLLSEAVEIYASIIISVNNPEKQLLLNEFEETYQLYQSYK